ncbi:MAG: hypothetical protein RLZZ627_1309 [Pseudomonadota bacterium]|jgi:hypothetical protein
MSEVTNSLNLVDHIVTSYSTHVIVASIILSCLGQITFRKLLGPERLQSCHEVGGYYFSVVGTFYAVLVGLIIFDAQARFDDAKTDVESEASALFMIHLHAERLPQPQGAEIQSLIKTYANRVIESEWETMKSGHRDDVARGLLVSISRKLDAIEPKTQGQQTVYDKVQDELTSAWTMRRQRISHVEYRLPDLEWEVLLIGGLVTVVFSYFFVLESLWMQAAMTSLMSLVIAFNIYVVVELSNPYLGSIVVSKKPFQVITAHLALNE